MSEKKIAMIGLDTSHTVVFTKLLQDPEVRVVDGMRVVKALRFPSAFQSEEGQDGRQADLERLGVTMAASVEEVVEGVDAVFLEINDPALHLGYYEQIASLGLPVFIDKPLAAKVAEGTRIAELAEKHEAPTWSASSLRFIPPLLAARAEIESPKVVHTFGALGKAAAGSDLVWYGVHTVEMLVSAIGTGAQSVRAMQDDSAIVLSVSYPDERRGLVECRRGSFAYGGRLQGEDNIVHFDSLGQSPYAALMKALRGFVVEGEIPVPLAEAQEVLRILEAGEQALASGHEAPVYGA